MELHGPCSFKRVLVQRSVAAISLAWSVQAPDLEHHESERLSNCRTLPKPKRSITPIQILCCQREFQEVREQFEGTTHVSKKRASQQTSTAAQCSACAQDRLLRFVVRREEYSKQESTTKVREEILTDVARPLANTRNTVRKQKR